MPLSLRNYEKFWADPQDKPTFLASFLPGFNVVDENNLIRQPKQPYARISFADPLVAPGFVIGEHSLFADKFQWALETAPENATYELGDLTAENLEILAATPGEYQFSLTVMGKEKEARDTASDTTMVTISIADVAPTLSFDTDIRAILGSADNSSCSNCHNANSDYPGIPAYYADSNPTAYYDVKARIDFADPENSPLLVKPTTIQHGGGIFIDRTTLAGENRYQQLLAWILAGAPCGNDPRFCPN